MSSSLRAIRGKGLCGWFGRWYIYVLHRRSNCSLARAMDGRIMRRDIISSCQSAATSEIVKALPVMSLTQVSSAIASIRPLSLHLPLPVQAKVNCTTVICWSSNGEKCVISCLNPAGHGNLNKSAWLQKQSMLDSLQLYLRITCLSGLATWYRLCTLRVSAVDFKMPT